MEHSVSPWAVRGLYLLALVLAITPGIELISTIWPLRPTELVWRYGAIGLGAAYLPNLALGFALLMLVAFWRRHSTVLIGAGVVSILIALVVLPAMVMFAMDMEQVRALRPEEQRGSMVLAAVLQEVKYLASALALGCLGLGGAKMGARVASADEDTGVRPGVVRAGSR